MARLEGGRHAEREEFAPPVRWIEAIQGQRRVVLAVLTDEGPTAFALSPLTAIFLAESLRDAAHAARSGSAQPEEVPLRCSG